MRPASLRDVAVMVLVLANMAFARTPNRVTILYDSFGKSPTLIMDWGFSALVEYGGKRILFDTGNNSQIFEHNVKALGVDLQKLDFVVMSHRHGDHMGGLVYLLKVNPTVKIYAPKERSGVYGDDQPSSTWYRKDASLPAEQRYYSGAPPETIHMGAAWPTANFQLIDKSTEIAPDMFLIDLVSDKPGTLELHELSLAIRTPDGLVLVVGCSQTIGIRHGEPPPARSSSMARPTSIMPCSTMRPGSWPRRTWPPLSLYFLEVIGPSAFFMAAK